MKRCNKAGWNSRLMQHTLDKKKLIRNINPTNWR